MAQAANRATPQLAVGQHGDEDDGGEDQNQEQQLSEVVDGLNLHGKAPLLPRLRR